MTSKNPDSSSTASDRDTATRSGLSLTEPLRLPVFRRIWLASLLSNTGLLIHGVGAAWMMMQLSSDTRMVALVQTALMLPVMLVSLAAGAIADMYDRRRVGIVALLISTSGAAGLTATTFLGMLTPSLLLLFCFLLGLGMALFGPAWQASVSEQVPAEVLPQAVALNSISFNVARSIGPAVGGFVVAAAGAVSAFLLNTLSYLPMLVVLLLWRRVHTPSRLPPERMARAITSGVRYVVHSPSIRLLLWRCLITGIIGGCASSLMPVVARDMLHGGAQTYGFILGAFGVGAVSSALRISELRQRFTDEQIVSASAIVMGVTIAIISQSTSTLLTAAAFLLTGAGWMLSITMFNVGIQLSAPRWVAGRTLAAFQTALAGGIALGSWMWGHVAQDHGVNTALFIAGVASILSTILRRWLPVPVAPKDDREEVDQGAPPIALALTGRSGPIVIEVEYNVALDDARSFHTLMQQVETIRSRNGAYSWSISRDITRPEIWTERYHCPTWHDYLRMRAHYTQAELAIQDQAFAFNRSEVPVVRRMLERPFGSVRWREDTPDQGLHEVLPISTG